MRRPALMPKRTRPRLDLLQLRAHDRQVLARVAALERKLVELERRG